MQATAVRGIAATMIVTAQFAGNVRLLTDPSAFCYSKTFMPTMGFVTFMGFNTVLLLLVVDAHGTNLESTKHRSDGTVRDRPWISHWPKIVFIWLPMSGVNHSGPLSHRHFPSAVSPAACTPQASHTRILKPPPREPYHCPLHSIPQPRLHPDHHCARSAAALMATPRLCAAASPTHIRLRCACGPHNTTSSHPPCWRAGLVLWITAMYAQDGHAVEVRVVGGGECDWGARAECSTSDAMAVATSLSVAAIAAYYGLYAFYLARAWRQLSDKLYQRFRMSNIVMRLQARPPLPPPPVPARPRAVRPVRQCAFVCRALAGHTPCIRCMHSSRHGCAARCVHHHRCARRRCGRGVWPGPRWWPVRREACAQHRTHNSGTRGCSHEKPQAWFTASALTQPVHIHSSHASITCIHCMHPSHASMRPTVSLPARLWGAGEVSSGGRRVGWPACACGPPPGPPAGGVYAHTHDRLCACRCGSTRP